MMLVLVGTPEQLTAEMEAMDAFLISKYGATGYDTWDDIHEGDGFHFIASPSHNPERFDGYISSLTEIEL